MSLILEFLRHWFRNLHGVTRPDGRSRVPGSSAVVEVGALHLQLVAVQQPVELLDGKGERRVALRAHPAGREPAFAQPARDQHRAALVGQDQLDDRAVLGKVEHRVGALGDVDAERVAGEGAQLGEAAAQVEGRDHHRDGHAGQSHVHGRPFLPAGRGAKAAMAVSEKCMDVSLLDWDGPSIPKPPRF